MLSCGAGRWLIQFVPFRGLKCKNRFHLYIYPNSSYIIVHNGVSKLGYINTSVRFPGLATPSRGNHDHDTLGTTKGRVLDGCPNDGENRARPGLLLEFGI